MCSFLKYMGCDVACDFYEDAEQKLNRLQKIYGTIRRAVGRKTRKETQMKFYKVMIVPSL